jgi:2OG-Fe(II) oxygenase superfamily
MQPDHVFINGRAIAFGEILSESFFASSKLKDLRKTFETNTPFPHVVLEGLFAPTLLELMYSEFDDLKWNDWRRHNTKNELKRGTWPNTRFGRAAELYFNTIHSAAFVNSLEQITGIEGLIADAALFSAGLHEVRTGGRFEVHLDFTEHSVTKLTPRLALITYLNQDWLPSYGGALELWSQEESVCKVKIEPTFGRSVVFAEGETCFHGHPDPVNASDWRPRRSAAAYFYTNGSKQGGRKGYGGTIYLTRAIPPAKRERIVGAVKYLTPPVLVDALGKLKTIIISRAKNIFR